MNYFLFLQAMAEGGENVLVQADAASTVNLATVAANIFSEGQVDTYMQVAKEQKNEFISHFMREW